MLSHINPNKYLRKFNKRERMQNKTKMDNEIHSDFLRYMRHKKRTRATHSFPFYWRNI